MGEMKYEFEFTINPEPGLEHLAFSSRASSVLIFESAVIILGY